MSAKKKFQEAKAKVKGHFVKHQDIYTILAVAVTSAAAGAAVNAAFNSRVPELVETEDSKQLVDVNVETKGVFYKSPVTNITTVLTSRDNPSIPVRCLDTGEVFASQNRAAAANDISANNLSRHLRGHSDSVKGLRFERIELPAQK